MTEEEKLESETETETETETESEREAEPEAETETQTENAAVVAAEAVVDWGRPGFARGFPEDAELAGLVAAFSRGDYGAVRTGAPTIIAREGVSKEIADAAALLRARIEPDRGARPFFYLAAALLVFLTVWWMTHDGPEHHAAPPAPVPPTVEFIK